MYRIEELVRITKSQKTCKNGSAYIYYQAPGMQLLCDYRLQKAFNFFIV